MKTFHTSWTTTQTSHISQVVQTSHISQILKRFSSLILTLGMLFSLSNIVSVSAYDLTDKDNTLIWQYISLFESKLAGKPTSEWQRIWDILNKKTRSITQMDSRKYAIYTALTDRTYNTGMIHMFEEKLTEKQALLAKANTQFESNSLSISDKEKLKKYIDALTTEIVDLTNNIKQLKEVQ